MVTYTPDVLVVGSGAAGLRAAIEAERLGVHTLVVSKSPAGMRTASAVTNGFFKAAVGGASKEEHLKATMDSGKGLCDPALVNVLVEEGPERIAELERFGMAIQIRKGSASCGDDPQARGLGFVKPLITFAKEQGVEFLENCVVSRLLLDHDRVVGAVGYAEEPVTIYAKATVLATGGCGALYSRTDCPLSLLGDGYALAYEAGAALRDMEFTQFVPVGLAEKGHSLVVIYGDLVDKGTVLNSEGEDIVKKYNITTRPLTTMARDQFSAAMMREVTEGRGVDGAVLLDATKIVKEVGLESLIPVDAQRKALERAGVAEKPIKIAPVSHFTMGGATITPTCATTLPGLYAAGEVTGGLHGANRIGGNAMTEIIVFGARAGASAAAETKKATKHTSTKQAEAEIEAYSKTMTGESSVNPLAELRGIMWDKVGIVRSGERLQDALQSIRKHQKAAATLTAADPATLRAVIETRFAAKVAELVAASALKREESRGTHYRTDYPNQSEKYAKPIPNKKPA
ncbi:MAG: FAD-binding protein [Candidatus Bathyarchaeota archaeon]|nr:FAD-binding protein [Candidatus Bathyarchaeota archaeon]